MLERISYLIIILTFSSIVLLSKSFTTSYFGIRPEDFPSLIAIILIPFLIIKIKNSINKVLLITIFAYFIYILTVSFIQSPFYFLNILVLFFKEVSFFGYFLMIYFLVINISKKDISKMFRIIFMICVPSFIYLLYQIVSSNVMGMYGVSFIGHEESPGSSGLISLMLFYLSFMYYQILDKNKLIFIFSVLSAIFVLFSGSKIAVVSFLVFLFFNVLFATNKKNFIYGFIGLILTFILLLISIHSGLGSLHRLDGIFSPVEAILNRGIWFKFFWIESWPDLIFGSGLSIGHVNEITMEFSNTMAMDNQFLYFILVLGFLGTLIFLLTLYFLLMSYKLQSPEAKIQLSLILAYFCGGMGAELFQLSISGLTFWFASGFLLANSKKYRNTI